MTQARLRPLAEADLIDKTAHYRSAGGNRLAERFFAERVVRPDAGVRDDHFFEERESGLLLVNGY